MATPEKTIYDVEVAPGLVIPIVGSEDESEDDLIAKARTHPKFLALQNKNNAPQAGAAQSNQANAVDDSTNLVPGVLPELSSPAELAKTAKQGSDFINQNVAKPPADSVVDRSKGSTFDLLSQGKYGEAWDTIPETVQTGILVGAPLTAATIAGGMGLKLARSKDDLDGLRPNREQRINPAERIEPALEPTGKSPNNIKSRTFEAGNYGEQNIRPSMSAKETQIAEEIKNKFGYEWTDIKNKFGLGDVPINDMTQAEMLANTVRNQEASGAPSAPAESSAPAPAAPTERNVNGVKMTEAQYQYYINEATPGISPTQAIEEMNAKSATPAAPIEQIKPAPVAETPKAPAPPPEASPQAAVPPTEEKKKAGRPSAKSLEGTTFRSDLGTGDNWLYNTYGPEGRRQILAEFNDGKPAGEYKNVEEILKKFKEKYPKIGLPFGMQGPTIPTEVARERGIPPPQSFGKLGKVAKIGGVAGLALTAAELANAAKRRDYGAMADIATDVFVPPFAQSTVLMGNEEQELARQQYEAMVGGGRGIAPPSFRSQVGRR